MERSPEISIIMPVYNMAQYLDQSVRSWLSQTMDNIEIICIDDASTDTSLEVLNGLAAEDSRIRVISLKQNKSAWTARKIGVKEAKGDYILFADADDAIREDACEKLYHEMKVEPVDILHFGSELINVNGLPDEWIKSLESFLEPFAGTLYGKEILTACFGEKRYAFTLWNKMFSASLCKRALENQPDLVLPKGQDKLTYFILSFYADSYKGIPGTKYYKYYYGRGSGGYQLISLKQFERYCKMGLVSDALSDFLTQVSAREQFKDIELVFQQELLTDCASTWLHRLSEEDKRCGFDKMLEYWDSTNIISFIADNLDDKRYEFAKQIKGAHSLEHKSTRIRTIATYYHSIENGGIARVLCSLVYLWENMGFQVIVITDQPPSQKDYNLPATVKRFIVPDFLTISGKNYDERASIMSKIIKDNNVDLVVYHAWVSHLMLWDELIIKSHGSAFIAYCHGVFSYALMTPWIRYQEIIAPYLLADAIVTLSDVDAKFWECFNDNVKTVQNPFTGNVSEWKPSQCDSHDILWVGRLSDEKNPYDALEIIKKVKKEIPDAKLYFLGESKVAGYEQALKSKVIESDLEDNVVFLGFHKDVHSYYEKASILLLTSKFEGYCLVLQEGMMAGLPIVMYELPYLTLTQNNSAINAVKQGDIQEAARLIVDLFRNENKRHKQATESRRFVEKIVGCDFKIVWEEIFDSLNKKQVEIQKDSERLMMETLVKHLDIGYQPYRDREPLLNRRIMKNAMSLVRFKDAATEKGLLSAIRDALREQKKN